MAEITTLRESIQTLIQDGQSVAFEGFTHLIPYAAGHELIRQGKQDLTLIRMTPDLIYDQVIGMRLASKLVFSWGGNPGVGSLHRFRDAVENSWPQPLKIEEHTHHGLSMRYVAGASGLPFGILRGYQGADLIKHTTNVSIIACPFTGEKVAAVAALHPETAVVHAQQADRKGNVQMWGIVGIQKEAIFAAKRVIVTVEEIVDTLESKPNSVVIPSRLIDAVCVEPRGTYPSYALGYTNRDNNFYKYWDGISRDRTSFNAWMETHVLGTDNFSEFLRSLGGGTQ